MTKEQSATSTSKDDSCTLSAIVGSVAESESEESELSLDRRYLYQNPSTGGISSTTLTVRQLCRMFSPPGVSAGPSRLFTAETQLLLLLAVGMYDPEGWYDMLSPNSIFRNRHNNNNNSKDPSLVDNYRPPQGN
jgi:hypothetical protein